MIPEHQILLLRRGVLLPVQQQTPTQATSDIQRMTVPFAQGQQADLLQAVVTNGQERQQ